MPFCPLVPTPLPTFRRPPSTEVPSVEGSAEDLAPRVRAIAAPFTARNGWIIAFCVLSGVHVLNDVIQRDLLGLAIDVFLIAALVSLWRSLVHFRRAARSGEVPALGHAMKELLGYVRITVVVGFVGLAVLMVVFLGLVLMISTGGGLGGLEPTLLARWTHG